MPYEESDTIHCHVDGHRFPPRARKHFTLGVDEVSRGIRRGYRLVGLDPPDVAFDPSQSECPGIVLALAVLSVSVDLGRSPFAVGPVDSVSLGHLGLRVGGRRNVPLDPFDGDGRRGRHLEIERRRSLLDSSHDLD